MSKQQLRQAGLKVTLPRRKILDILEQSENHHLSAEDIYRQLLQANEDVSLATVYRVLIQFQSAGIVTRHHFAEGHSIYELNQGEHHDHLVCVKCDCVEEFVDHVIEEHQEKIAEKSGFKMTDHSLTIYGLCKNCQ